MGSLLGTWNTFQLMLINDKAKEVVIVERDRAGELAGAPLHGLTWRPN